MYPLESDEVTRKPRRLPRVEFVAGTLEAAQVERQLGDEDVAAVIGKSVKTWQRWRRGNYVHEDVAPRVMELLEVQPVRPLRRVPSSEEIDLLAIQVRELRAEISAQREQNARLAERLVQLERRQGHDTDPRA